MGWVGFGFRAGMVIWDGLGGFGEAVFSLYECEM